MSKEKFQKIKIEPDKRYLINFRVPIIGGEAWIYEYGKDIRIIKKKYIKAKTWMIKKIHFRYIIKIEEV